MGKPDWSIYGLNVDFFMKTKLQKKETVDKLSKKIPDAGMLVFTSFSREGEKGLSVAKMREFKKKLKETGGEYFVAKKNLIGVAAKQSGISEMVNVSKLGGSVGLVFGGKDSDSLALSKSVYDFSKGSPVFRIFGAILEKKYIDADKFKDLARIGSKEALYARLLGMMQYPVKSLLVLLKNIKQ